MAVFGLTLRPEWKKQWLEALRSGQYQQVAGELVDGTMDSANHCCLGVLGEVSGLKRITDEDGSLVLKWPRGPKEEQMMMGLLSGKYFDRFVTFNPSHISMEEKDYLDSCVAHLDLKINKDFVVDKLQYKLSKMNDGGNSFEHIADWIEEHL